MEYLNKKMEEMIDAKFGDSQLEGTKTDCYPKELDLRQVLE